MKLDGYIGTCMLFQLPFDFDNWYLPCNVVNTCYPIWTTSTSLPRLASIQKEKEKKSKNKNCTYCLQENWSTFSIWCIPGPGVVVSEWMSSKLNLKFAERFTWQTNNTTNITTHKIAAIESFLFIAMTYSIFGLLPSSPLIQTCSTLATKPRLLADLCNKMEILTQIQTRTNKELTEMERLCS